MEGKKSSQFATHTFCAFYFNCATVIYFSVVVSFLESTAYACVSRVYQLADIFLCSKPSWGESVKAINFKTRICSLPT